MKKLLVYLLSVVMLFSVLGLSACGNTQDEVNSLNEKITSLENEIADLKKDKLPDFKDCEIGYQLEVYPKVAFDYKISEDCIVHIESITATLTAKNIINEGDVLEDAFYPFIVEAKVVGWVVGTPPSDANGVRLWIDLLYDRLSASSPRIELDNDGILESVFTLYMLDNQIVYFLKIR